MVGAVELFIKEMRSSLFWSPSFWGTRHDKGSFVSSQGGPMGLPQAQERGLLMGDPSSLSFSIINVEILYKEQ